VQRQLTLGPVRANVAERTPQVRTSNVRGCVQAERARRGEGMRQLEHAPRQAVAQDARGRQPHADIDPARVAAKGRNQHQASHAIRMLARQSERHWTAERLTADVRGRIMVTVRVEHRERAACETAEAAGGSIHGVIEPQRPQARQDRRGNASPQPGIAVKAWDNQYTRYTRLTCGIRFPHVRCVWTIPHRGLSGAAMLSAVKAHLAVREVRLNAPNLSSVDRHGLRLWLRLRWHRDMNLEDAVSQIRLNLF